MNNKFKVFLNNYFKGSVNNLLFTLKKVSKFDRNSPNLENSIQSKDVWIIDSSSSFNKKSLFNNFASYLKEELSKNNLGYANIICASGPRFCQVGASPKNPNNPMPCATCIDSSLKTNSNNIYFLSDDKNNIPNTDTDNIKVLIKPSKKWLLRESSNFKVAQNLENKLVSASHKWINFLDQFKNEDLPKIAFIFNGYTFPEAIIKSYLEKKGVKVLTYESGFLENSIFVTDKYAPELFFNYKKRSLTSSEKEKLKIYVERRKKGNFDRAGTSFWNEITELSEEYKDYFSNYKKVVSIFLNVPFDTSQESSNKLFENMYHWVEYLKLIVQKNKEILFIFRSHPDELRVDKASNYPINKYIKKLGINEFNNVLSFDSSSSVNSYDLIEYSDLVLSYNSTISLEAFYLKTNVINAGYSHFARVPYYELPKNIESYEDKINFYLKNNDIDLEQYQEVESYFYQLIFESSIDLSGYVEKVGKYEYTRINVESFKNKKLESLIRNIKKEF